VTEEEERLQQELHDTIERVLRVQGDITDQQILTGWVICFETDNLVKREDRCAGTFYGPREMSTWRALGLVEWARRFSLVPGKDDDET
jgi:hypothetical protein